MVYDDSSELPQFFHLGQEGQLAMEYKSLLTLREKEWISADIITYFVGSINKDKSR